MLVAMTGVEATDAAREIEETIAVYVFEACILGTGDVDRGCVRKATRDGRFPAGG
jgi:hypothetical protein